MPAETPSKAGLWGRNAHTPELNCGLQVGFLPGRVVLEQVSWWREDVKHWACCHALKGFLLLLSAWSLYKEDTPGSVVRLRLVGVGSGLYLLSLLHGVLLSPGWRKSFRNGQ
jgi:hypothetical protein